VVSTGAAALTREVLKAMQLSRIKTTAKFAAAVLLALSLAGAGLRQAMIRADGKPAVRETYRITVTDVLQSDEAVVTQFDVAVPPDATVEMVNDKGKHGSFTYSGGTPDPDRQDGMVHLQFVLVADQVEVKEPPLNVVKLLLAFRVGKLSQ